MNKANLQPEPDPLRRHPPERREQKKQFVVLYSCCCCCCCCLHTLGSAIGAAAAGDFRPEPTAPRAQGMFWICAMVSAVIGSLIYAVVVGPGSPWIPVVIVVIFGPLVLLGASALMALWIAVRPDLPSKGQYFQKLLRITGGNIAGCLIGILVMWLIAICM